MDKKKILIVEDSANLTRLLSLKLRAAGYDVLVLEDGVECLKTAEKEKPDVILLDVKMPNKDGLKTFESLLGSPSTSSIPVIFMTAYPKQSIKELVLDMGAKNYIMKPFKDNEVETAIKNAIG